MQVFIFGGLHAVDISISMSPFIIILVSIIIFLLVYPLRPPNRSS
jgi:hypothetical protein